MSNYADETLTFLVTKATNGDPIAWNEIVDRMENMVWSIVRSFRLGEADSHDAAQMVWLRIIENLDQVQDPERLGLWISTTARRECLHVMEKARRTTLIDPDKGFDRFTLPNGDLTGTIETDHINREDVERVLNALNELGPDCRSILRMVLCDPPMNYREISEASGIAVGTIGPRRKRCLSQLRSLSGL